MKHYLISIGIILVGTLVRFWMLDSKPLGIDEVLTAIFSLGKGYQDIPKDFIFTPSDLQQLFTLQPEKSCPEIARTIATQSTHPPLFFCLMHQWLTLIDFSAATLAWKLRSLPALLGVGAIGAVYLLNRIAFSRAAGVMGAAAMAVSPFALYLSQEARHYSLPVLLITLALAGLVQIQKDFERGKQRPIIWLAWSSINGLSFYVHYFCAIAFIAELFTLGILFYRAKIQPKLSSLFFCIFPCILFFPWLSVLSEHFTNPKTGWISASENIAPLYQILVAWLSMAIALPIENRALSIQILTGLSSLVFGIWLAKTAWSGLKQNWRDRFEVRGATVALGCFIAVVLIEFLAIVYLLNKDLTVAPRYNFVYYPAVCALLGAGLSARFERPRKKLDRATIVFVFFSLLSCILVVFDLAFKKPYLPQSVASHLNRSPDSLMVAIGYQDTIELALGLSYTLALKDIRASDRPTFLVFLSRVDGYEKVWEELANFSVSPANLWIVAPGLKRIEYPQHLDLGKDGACDLDPKKYYRIGVPYQLYRCHKQSEAR